MVGDSATRRRAVSHGRAVATPPESHTCCTHAALYVDAAYMLSGRGLRLLPRACCLALPACSVQPAVNAADRSQATCGRSPAVSGAH